MRKFFTTNKRYAGRFFMASASLCIISVNLMMSSCQEDSSFLGYDLLDNSESLKAIETRCMDQPFGDGKASIRIAEILKEHFDR